MDGQWSSSNFPTAPFPLCTADYALTFKIVDSGRPDIIIVKLKKLLPNFIKHPLLAYEWWRWKSRGLPAQSRQDILLFKAALSQVGNDPLKVFEWGSGASTIYYPRYLDSIGRRFDWHAMDNSRPWYRKCQDRISKAKLEERVHAYYSEFPAFWEYPKYSIDDPIPPQSEIESLREEKYDNFPVNLGLKFDLIVVDGRYRRRCLIAAKDALADDGVLILHDAQRTHYHSSLTGFGQVEWLTTGYMPGTKQLIQVALCSLNQNLIISRLAKKFAEPS